MNLVQESIEKYAENHTPSESEAMAAIRKITEKELQYSNMLSGPLVAGLLKLLITISGARTILEIGTFTGYGTLAMAESLPEDGTIVTCDYNERYEEMAKRGWEQSPHREKIEMKMGAALETMGKFTDQTFELVFLDADKTNYLRYYEESLRLLKKGGLLVIDNIFWSGTVLEPAGDEKAEAIHRLNERISGDNRVENVMLTIRDGLNLVRKK
mgnify:CR=1 FL=1